MAKVLFFMTGFVALLLTAEHYHVQQANALQQNYYRHGVSNVGIQQVETDSKSFSANKFAEEEAEQTAKVKLWFIDQPEEII